MTKKEFLENIVEELEIEGIELSFDTNVKDIEEWDSLATLSLIAFADSSFSKKITGNDVSKIIKIQDLVDLLGIELA